MQTPTREHGTVRTIRQMVTTGVPPSSYNTAVVNLKVPPRAVASMVLSQHACFIMLVWIGFAADRIGQISLTLLEDGRCVRHYLNPALPLNKAEVEAGMVPGDKGKIVSICVASSSHTMYVARESGTVTVIDISPMLAGGQIGLGGRLDSLVKSDEVVFAKNGMKMGSHCVSSAPCVSYVPIPFWDCATKTKYVCRVMMPW